MRRRAERADIDAEMAHAVDDHVVLDELLNVFLIVHQRYKSQASVGWKFHSGKRVKDRGHRKLLTLAMFDLRMIISFLNSICPQQSLLSRGTSSRSTPL